MRMQLRTPRGSMRAAAWGPAGALVVVVAVTCGFTPRARGAEPPHDESAAEARSPSAGPSSVPSSVTKTTGIEMGTYTDDDHVTVYTPSVHLGVESTGGASLQASYLVDVVSAASVDVVSTASSRWREVRQAGTLDGQYKPSDFGVAVGGSISSEPDYLAYGAYAKLIKDFAEKNWTVTLGYGYSHDTAGRCAANGCTPFSVFSRNLERSAFNAGVAWVADARSVAGIGVDVMLENGDPSKPYRYVPMFAPGVAVPRGASVAEVNALRLPERPLEQLPLSRQRVAVMGHYARRLEGSTIRLEERVYDDSWGLIASSTDLKWIFDVGSRVALWPHARFHAQSAVSFWQRAYVSGPAPGWSLPEFRTGDRELGPLWTADGGLGLRFYLGSAIDPQAWAIGLTADVAYTDFLDDLYLTARLATFGALTLEVRW
jgi:hypothetical protein